MKTERLIANLLPTLALLTVVPSCSAGKPGQTEQDSIRMERDFDAHGLSIPDSLFDPVERADYAVAHYWDGYDFRNDNFGDTEFGQFAEYAVTASDEAVGDAVATLMHRLEKYPEAFRKMASLAEEWFYRKGSECYSERVFAKWLNAIDSSEILTAAEHDRYAYLLTATLKNAVGSKAEDIRFRTPEGAEKTLYTLGATPYTMLVLYDPDCDTCHEVLAKVRARKEIMQLVDRGVVRVVLIDVADDEALFRKDAMTMPRNWTMGHDLTRVEDNDLYIFDTTPALYLLDSQKRVLLKEPTVDELIDYARSH